jgi:hypothetical protein
MNIKNTDFRLLNLVEYQNWNNDKTPAYFMIRDIFWDEGKVALSNGKILLPSPSLELIKPIPLTDEWIKKFGFERQDNNWKTLCICNDWTYLHWERLAGLELSVNKHSVMLSHIIYVHQLQNIYFDLTGVELSIS